MRTLKIDIAEDTVSKIQRIHSETEARMLLLNRLMETHLLRLFLVSEPVTRRC